MQQLHSNLVQNVIAYVMHIYLYMFCNIQTVYMCIGGCSGGKGVQMHLLFEGLPSCVLSRSAQT